eukprot:CAMPEP_0204178612 /NCGR_PEP_ID=MMETSP0361-20130328/49469_1 /ASSEMBLY_ACC=CAM_ASM_000343 /TAXON_ID=268821 /ORGANISM="Scrippsiella Hangoei, Strain SHTV-5" /LENGTH=60 /DNA_ID=CAMNT_0051137753 /DNA_START=11 /DNA_END=190 /DNA_ORIENTATION=-
MGCTVGLHDEKRSTSEGFAAEGAEQRPGAQAMVGFDSKTAGKLRQHVVGRRRCRTSERRD